MRIHLSVYVFYVGENVRSNSVTFSIGGIHWSLFERR